MEKIDEGVQDLAKLVTCAGTNSLINEVAKLICLTTSPHFSKEFIPNLKVLCYSSSET